MKASQSVVMRAVSMAAKKVGYSAAMTVQSKAVSTAADWADWLAHQSVPQTAVKMADTKALRSVEMKAGSSGLS